MGGEMSSENELARLYDRAARLRDQVLKTWAPPRKAGREFKADIAQTATMQTIAFIMGREVLVGLTENQQAAIDEGLELMNRVLLERIDQNRHPLEEQPAALPAAEGAGG